MDLQSIVEIKKDDCSVTYKLFGGCGYILKWLNWKWTDDGPAIHNSVLGKTVSSTCPAMQVSLDMHTKPEEWSTSSFLRWGILNGDLMEIDHELFNKGSLV